MICRPIHLSIASLLALVLVATAAEAGPTTAALAGTAARLSRLRDDQRMLAL